MLSLLVVSSFLQLLILCNHGDHMGLIFGYNRVDFPATLLRLNNTCFIGIIPPGHNVLIFEMIECLTFPLSACIFVHLYPLYNLAHWFLSFHHLFFFHLIFSVNTIIVLFFFINIFHIIPYISSGPINLL